MQRWITLIERDMNFNLLFMIVDFFSNRIFERVKSDKLYSYMSQKGIEKLFLQDQLKYGFLDIDNSNTWTMDFTNKIIQDIKRIRDTYLIGQLPAGISHEIYFLANEVMASTDRPIFSVLLIGSASRRAMHTQSDIDLLVVAGDKFQFRPKSSVRRAQVEVLSRDDFRTAFCRGDELVIWAIKHGLIIHDNLFIFDFYGYTHANIGKHSILRKRKLIYNLTEDICTSKSISTERLRAKLGSLIYQMARYILILDGEVPLAKRELADQVRRYSPDLAGLIAGYESEPSMDSENLTKLFFRVRRAFSSHVGAIDRQRPNRPPTLQSSG
ncbi:MAG: hypothetical protein P4L43_07430 [Syntrophobacteraceae bacterium]|nr:hypothetical protein [Syntrophobacteraceae bacterium]